ncbi:MAG: transcription antitermination factor NusB [Candidatus Jidaibacter sp.]|jgi:N utilization substance protein B|nr:transcription antitermination factor NusB [Candidatus Jidaibacter sp.]
MAETSSITKRIFSKAILQKRAARILAVQCLYSIVSDDTETKSIDEKVNDIINVYGNELSESKFSKADQSALIKLVRFTSQNKPEFESKISEHLATNWKFNRLPRVVSCILTCAVAELFLDKNLDREIIINDYLEIAKIFNHEGEVGFINSILDKVSIAR